MEIHSHFVQKLLAENIMWELVQRHNCLGQYQQEKTDSGIISIASFWKLEMDMVSLKSLSRDPKVEEGLVLTFISCPSCKLPVDARHKVCKFYHYSCIFDAPDSSGDFILFYYLKVKILAEGYINSA